MVGNTGGIVTDYKDIMNGKREIPISSCPPCVEDAVYGGGSTISPDSPDEESRFEQLLDKLDRRAEKAEKKKSPVRKKTVTRMDKVKAIRARHGACEFSYPIVDTENCFMFRGEEYVISDQAVQYGSKTTELGELFDMDRIVCVTANSETFFYDMDLNLMRDDWVVKKVLSK